MRKILFAVSLAFICGPALAEKKSCDDLMAEINAKLEAKGVKNYTLEAVSTETAGDQQVVGSCDGGMKKLVYKRG